MCPSSFFYNLLFYSVDILFNVIVCPNLFFTFLCYSILLCYYSNFMNCQVLMSRLNLLRSCKKKKKRHQHISFTHIFISFTFIMQPVTMGTLEDIRRGSHLAAVSPCPHTLIPEINSNISRLPHHTSMWNQSYAVNPFLIGFQFSPIVILITFCDSDVTQLIE